ncbi:MAG: DEAD/DEAH box helicase [Bauldia sp.]|nr:DEAD/DEAH box helicase [Bauldia sp.]MCW5716882.1 DEAD/DEAH box helicase [Bauldia sp.]
MSAFDFSFDASGVVLKVRAPQPGWLGSLSGRRSRREIAELTKADQGIALALGDLQAEASPYPGELAIDSDTIRMTHRVASAISRSTADALGLPADVDLTFRTDVEGTPGSMSFRPRYEWVKNGQKQVLQRTGSILKTSSGPRRLPLWLMEAVEVVDAFRAGDDDGSHWETLARFRRAIDPPADTLGPRLSMTDFLKGLEVRLADGLSISPNADGTDFEIIPFSGQSLDASGTGNSSEAEGELSGSTLRAFQQRTRTKGALPAYRVGDSAFLVVDRGALTVLEVMVRKQGAPREERAEFIRNPTQAIAEAVEGSLRKQGRLDGLDAQGEEEAIESLVRKGLVETVEYSERVQGVRAYAKAALDLISGSGTTWLPEQFAEAVRKAIESLDHAALTELRSRVAEAINQGAAEVLVDGATLPANAEILKALDIRLAAASGADRGPGGDPRGSESLILDTKDNYSEVAFERKEQGRSSLIDNAVPSHVRTSLKAHQVESLTWQIEAWRAGLPGILNADEQGLGKTLQTIAFLAWLQRHMTAATAAERGPILVVAPTSLLQNWEMEVERHLDEPYLGHLIRLYGGEVARRRRDGTRGRDTESGEAKLDFDRLETAVREGRAHRFWILTTYTTLTNYQHSLGRIRFSAVVFDEIQNLKNPDSLRANAARAMNADFRIGLTGTPIENSSIDLWAIMDQLAPGKLGSLREFRAQYGTPTAENMAELYGRVFEGVAGRPPLALRRLKEDVAADLPAKQRRLYPRLMPGVQAAVYEEARAKLAGGGAGAALKMLHHIRSVSVHPALGTGGADDAFVDASARLSATLSILDGIKARGERALVFIEHLKMQYRFIELAKARFGLGRIDLINGETPIQQRQAIVNRFQKDGADGRGFDLLVLGPKAAGVGLTLTAATHVIHLSRWWNPAVEEQCNDRVHRIGQTRPVTIHVPLAIHGGYREHSFDCLLHSLMERKRKLAKAALWPMGDTLNDADELAKGFGQDKTPAGANPVRSAVAAMFTRDGYPAPKFDADDSVGYA